MFGATVNYHEDLRAQLMRRGTTCTETKLDEYRDDALAMTTIKVIRVPACPESREKLALAISRFLPTLSVPEQRQAEVRGKTKYSVEDRDAVPSDVLGCNLFLHETKGPHKGDQVEEPWLSVTFGSGTKHLLWLSGKPQRTCAFCKQSQEPIKRDPHSKTTFHSFCMESAKRKALAPNREMSLERRLLAEAKG